MFNETRKKNFHYNVLAKITINTVRRIAWLEFRQRTWQAAKSLGELHASIEPKISYRKTCSYEHSERKGYAGN